MKPKGSKSMLSIASLRESFIEDGYVKISLIEFIPEIDRIIKEVGADVGQDKWQKYDSVLRLSCNKYILLLLESLYNRTPFPFQTLNFLKGPHFGVHSDEWHFGTMPAGLMCGVWVAFEDVTIDNGPLYYYRGSHRLPPIFPAEVGLTLSTDNKAWTENVSKYSEYLDKKLQALELTKDIFLCKKGEAIIWASNLIHGSIVAKENTTRLSQVTHYFFDGCAYYTPGNSNMSDIKHRRPFEMREAANSKNLFSFF